MDNHIAMTRPWTESDRIFFDKITRQDFLFGHTWFQGLDGDWSSVIPQAFVHLTELTVPDLLDEFERTLRYLPLILRVVG